MPIYEYEGQHYDIETNDPQEAKNKILASLGPPKTAGDYVADFGKGAASLADTALNAVTGTLDMAAYPLARAYYGTVGGMNAQDAATRAQQETTSPKDIIGHAMGIAQSPAYKNEISRRAMNAIGEGVQGLSKPIAESTGLPEQDINNMIGWGTTAVAPAVPKVAGAVGRGAEATAQGIKNVAGAAYDTGAGALSTATGRTAAPGATPKPWQQPSVRQPVGETYIPADVLEQYRAGQLTAEQAQAASRPTSELKGLSATGGTVPYAGQGWRAFGEQLGETYRNPLNLLTDVGLDALTGGPIPTIGRMGYKGYQAYNANKLSNLGFSPLTAEEQAAFSARGPVPPSSTPPAPPPSGPIGPIAPGGASNQNNVSNMMVNNVGKPTSFTNKTDFLEQKMINDLSGLPTVGSYPMGNKTIHVEQYKNWPFMDTLPPIKTYATDAKGNRVPIGETWTDVDPKPAGVQIKEKMNKKNKGK